MPLQLDGKVTSGPDLSVQLHGMKLPNPFVIGSGACDVQLSWLAASAISTHSLTNCCRATWHKLQGHEEGI